MPVPSFLRFEPVSVRPRSDGWSPSRQRRFILSLARGMTLDEAARSVGRSRQSAYLLRKKPGAEAFASAWDLALQFAHRVRTASQARPCSQFGVDRLLVPRFYRGRLVGFVQRDDIAAALRKLDQLDRIAARLGPPLPEEREIETGLDSLVPDLVDETCRT